MKINSLALCPHFLVQTQKCFFGWKVPSQIGPLTYTFAWPFVRVSTCKALRASFTSSWKVSDSYLPFNTILLIKIADKWIYIYHICLYPGPVKPKSVLIVQTCWYLYMTLLESTKTSLKLIPSLRSKSYYKL